MARPFLPVVVVALVVTSFGAAPAVPASAAPAVATDDPSIVVQLAVEFLAASQQADGGFELAGFPGFETPDAVLAIAEAGQQSESWSTSDALAAVEAVHTPGGLDGLDALDDLADTADLSAGQAAKLIVLDVAPLGLDPTDFDPSDDSAAPVDLAAILHAGAQPDGTYGTFNATLFAALALPLLGRHVPSVTVDAIFASQEANGGWGFSGDPNPPVPDLDPDTTGLAIQALVAAGVDGTAPQITAALALLASLHQADGSWPSPFDTGNPNSTALAILGVRAAGWDPERRCWVDAVAPHDGAYPSPDGYLAAQQAADGHIASPVDQFGVTTFATSQAVEGLERTWLPTVRAAMPACPTDAVVSALYQDLLGRDAGAEEVAFWEGFLAAGSTRAAVAQDITSSPEGRVARINRFYNAYLDRDADPAGITFWVQLLDTFGGDDTLVRSGILASNEFKDGATTTADFVNKVYLAALGRDAEPAGLAYWADLLDSGEARSAVTEALVGTDESGGYVAAQLYDDPTGPEVDDAYAPLLDRPADPDGLAFWSTASTASAPETVIGVFAGSIEYLAHAQG